MILSKVLVHSESCKAHVLVDILGKWNSSLINCINDTCFYLVGLRVMHV